MMCNPSGPAPARILNRTYLLSPTGCLIWKGGADSKDYGMIRHAGIGLYVHRVVFEALKRKLEPGEVVRHTCDRSRCCNIDHLIPGTKGDNIRDAFARNRIKTKRIPDSVIEDLRSGKISCKEVSLTYKVTVKHAYNVKRGHKR